MDTQNLIKYIFPDANNYHFKSWKDCFPDGKVHLRSLVYNNNWDNFFDSIQKYSWYSEMEHKLSMCLSNQEETILPHAELVFNSLNVLSPHKIKVIIIGQDPYPNVKNINNTLVPDATGNSFSAPLNSPKPRSLGNIYHNLLRFGHIDKIPNSGCLSYWILQGCFMINATLTTYQGKYNVHRDIWKLFADHLINYINDQCHKIVFMVWGKDAHNLCKYVNPNSHYIITSSHPSPRSFDKTLNGFEYGKLKNESDRKKITYPAFIDTDHFGMANNYFESNKILWNVFDIE